LDEPCTSPNGQEFDASEHGQHVGKQPLWQQETLETSSPPLQFSTGSNLLAGIKVLDLTRAIAVRTLPSSASPVG
jgi:hypothetical protein